MQTGTMAMNTPMNAAPATASRWPRIVLMIFAVVGLLSALSGVGGVIANMLEDANPGIDGWLLWASAPVHGLLALAALVFALRGNVPRAIMALAAVTLANLLMDLLPSIFRHGVEFGGFGGLVMAVKFFVLPLIAIGAIVLAARNERLGLATLLAILPTLFSTAMVVAFGIGVMIYGF